MRILEGVCAKAGWFAALGAVVFLAGCATPHPRPGVSPPRIALAGDSWSLIMRWHHGFAKAYVAEGYRMRQVRHVAIGWSLLDGRKAHLVGKGIEADELNTPTYKARLAAFLERYPTIKVIHLSAGGADVLHDLHAGMSGAEQERYLRDVVIPNVAGLVDYINEAFPDKHVALVGYDYLNIPAKADSHERARMRWDNLGRPDNSWMNDAIRRLNRLQRAFAEGHPGVRFIEYLGHTKARLGLAHKPGEPNPEDGMWIDGMHLSRDGNRHLAAHCLDVAYREWIGPLTDINEIELARDGRRVGPAPFREAGPYRTALGRRTQGARPEGSDFGL